MEFAEALEDALECAKMAADVNHHRAELLSLMLAGVVESELGHFSAAQEHLERGLDLARTISAGNFEAQIVGLMARVIAAQGRMSEAHDLSLRAIGIIREVGMTFVGPTVLAVRAALTDDPHERKGALEEAESILDMGCVAHNHFWFARAAIDHALAIGEWDEAERYAGRLEAYTREQPLAWSDFMIAQGQALAAWGQGSRKPELVTELERLRGEAGRAGLITPMSALKNVLEAG
jgi:tetratricopeptide (TPR) repeat protein